MANIFEENAYVKKIDTKIKMLNKQDKTIELEENIFYAKGGGQPGDIGEIIIDGAKKEVKDTIKIENSITNILDDVQNLEIGKIVLAKIDWIRRYKHMRMHSALHLMCASIPLDVTGGQIGYEKSRLDFNDPEKKINKEELEEKINSLMKENHYISYEFIESEILEKQPDLVRTMSVKPPRINGKLRFVKIGNIDFQPCGGTHVASTIEIGEIKIGKIESKGRMNRRVSILLND